MVLLLKDRLRHPLHAKGETHLSNCPALHSLLCPQEPPHFPVGKLTVQADDLHIMFSQPANIFERSPDVAPQPCGVQDKQNIHLTPEGGIGDLRQPRADHCCAGFLLGGAAHDLMPL